MYSGDFIKQLARKKHRPQKYYRTALTEILAELQVRIKEGNRVIFPGFGTFYTRVKKAGTATNFKTKQRVRTPEVRIAQFRPGEILKQAVRKKSLINSLLPKIGRKKK
jgi:DNA-binding protein HU-beta